MRNLLAAAILVPALFAAPACNLQSSARVDSIYRMNEGIKQLQKNNLSGAEKAMKEAIQMDPTHASAHANLGKLYRKEGKLADAEKAFQDAINNMGDKPDASYYFDMGMCQVGQAEEKGVSNTERNAKYTDAIAAFQEATKINANHYKAHYRIGYLYEKLDDPQKADQAYRQAINVNGAYSPAIVALGNMYIDYGHSNVAMAVLDTGTKVNDTDAQMWNGLGRAHLALNQPTEAVEAFKKAKAIDPEMPDVLFGLGMAYAELRQKNEAAENLEAFLKKAGQDVPEDLQKAANDTLARMQDVI
jgi:tetratricopeptide (TPR) repeat protein